jgi:hypothetical protein
MTTESLVDIKQRPWHLISVSRESYVTLLAELSSDRPDIFSPTFMFYPTIFAEPNAFDSRIEPHLRLISSTMMQLGDLGKTQKHFWAHTAPER